MLSVLLLHCSGCGRLTDADVVGTYVRSGRGITDYLELGANGKFQELITYTNGGKWSADGRWELKEQVVQLDTSLNVFDVENPTVIIPPELVWMRTLWVGNDQLERNEFEPIYKRTKVPMVRK